MLNALRLQVSDEVSDQLRMSEVRRCVGFSESLMLNVVEKREVIVWLSGAISKLHLQLHDLTGVVECSLRDEVVVCVVVETLAEHVDTMMTSNVDVV